MAPQASAVGYEWNNDISEATSAAGNGMLISNHSYGYAARNSLGQPQLPDYYFGGYITDSRDWDEIMFNAPYYFRAKLQQKIIWLLLMQMMLILMLMET